MEQLSLYKNGLHQNENGISSLALQMKHYGRCLKLKIGDSQYSRGSGAYLLRVKSLKLCSVRKTVRQNSIKFR